MSGTARYGRGSSRSPERTGPIEPKVATEDQIRKAIEKIRDDEAYGPNINITNMTAPLFRSLSSYENPTSNYHKFAKSFKFNNGRFIADPMVELGTTVNCFIGAHSAVKGILTAVDPPNPAKNFTYSVLHVDFPVVPFTSPPAALQLPNVLPNVSYVLGNLLRQSLLGEPLLMALKNIIESDDNLSIEDICQLLNNACKKLRDIKFREVTVYLDFCENQLKKRSELLGPDKCSGEPAFPPEFINVLRKFAGIFLVQANYVECGGIPLKSIVFSEGSSDVYNISWKFVDDSLKGHEQQYAEFVKNVSYNISLNIRVGIPDVGIFVIDMSLDKVFLHDAFKNEKNEYKSFFIILPDFVTFLQIYLSSEEFKKLICDYVKVNTEHRDDRFKARILTALAHHLMIVRIFDKGCASCNEVVDFTEPTKPKNLNLSLDFHYSENTGTCPGYRKCFTVLPDVKQSILGLDLSKCLIHATVSKELSEVLTPSDTSGDLFRTEQGSSQEGYSQEAQVHDSQIIESPLDFEHTIPCVKNVNLVTEREELERNSEQILQDVEQLRQPVRSGDTSLSRILSLFTGLATSVIHSLRTTVGMGGGSVINLRKYRKKTIHQRLKNKKYSKKYSKKQNKIIRKTHRVNTKYKIRKSIKSR